MRIRFDETDRCVVCHLVGNLELLSVVEFRKDVARLSAQRHVVFDLSGVAFVDSFGIRALINEVRRTRAQGGHAVICAVRRSVRKLLEVVGFSWVASSFGTVGDALAYLRQPAVA
jgi:anti-anti-sigma factor